MLSPEERRGLIEEAASDERREVLRRYARPRALPPECLLVALGQAAAVLRHHASLPRRRPRPGTYLL